MKYVNIVFAVTNIVLAVIKLPLQTLNKTVSDVTASQSKNLSPASHMHRGNH